MSIRIAAVGLSHNHIYNQVNALLSAGAELVSFFSDEPDRAVDFIQLYPQATQARSIDEILEDPTIHLVASAARPNERAVLGIDVMQHGKDYSCAKPGFTSLEQLVEVRRVQAETKRIYTVHFGERFDNPATVKAGDLVHGGAIGRVVQTIGFGPHRLLGHIPRAPWSFDKHYFGGILNDLASHQVEQFLYFTGSASGTVVSAQVGNFNFPQYPDFEDFGDLTLRSDKATGYVRVDWLTPRGLDTWGDVRLFILGTDGYIELRKNIDIAGRSGKDHLFITDHKSTRYIDCSATALPYGKQLLHDVLYRTETAMSQAHCFLTSELTLTAQQKAVMLTS